MISLRLWNFFEVCPTVLINYVRIFQNPSLYWRVKPKHLIRQKDVDPAFIREFPDAKDRVLIKISNQLDKHLREITSIAERIEVYSNQLHNHYLKLNESFMKIDWSNNELLPSVMKILIWSDRCWKYHHTIYINIDFAAKSFALDKDHSVEWIKKMNTYIDFREIIYRDPILDMFPAIIFDIVNMPLPSDLFL